MAAEDFAAGLLSPGFWPRTESSETTTRFHGSLIERSSLGPMPTSRARANGRT